MSTEIPTHDELRALAEAEARSRAAQLTDWREGSNLDGIGGAGAIMADDVLRVIIDRIVASFMGTAEGDDLDKRIVDFGGPDRDGATSAIAPYVLTRGAYVGAHTVTLGTTITGTAPDGTLLECSTNGRTWFSTVWLDSTGCS